MIQFCAVYDLHDKLCLVCYSQILSIAVRCYVIGMRLVLEMLIAVCVDVNGPSVAMSASDETKPLCIARLYYAGWPRQGNAQRFPQRLKLIRAERQGRPFRRR